MIVYDLTVKDIENKDVHLKEYKDKILLIVNIATRCGFTPQLNELEKLYKEYQSKGLEILAFPCNQFLHQAPENDSEIQSFCSLKYNVSFKVFKKIDVNGKNEDPLYKLLKSRRKGVFSKRIKWNFTKFLLDGNGNVIKRFAPSCKISKIQNEIDKLI